MFTVSTLEAGYSFKKKQNLQKIDWKMLSLSKMLIVVMISVGRSKIPTED